MKTNDNEKTREVERVLIMLLGLHYDILLLLPYKEYLEGKVCVFVHGLCYRFWGIELVIRFWLLCRSYV
ncbi:hypothetical protein B0J14DRAFT_33137 [Halenospora varia]|nr:hypothetical protein B0J14DRAFT_33137 [Halenospora varia]